MLVRIVKMQFKREFVPVFKQTFEKYRNEIRQSQGCVKLELLQDINHPEIFMTYSWWQDEKSLEAYRFSSTFKEVWPLTKVGFAEKPQAWSLKQKDIVEPTIL
jgi:(4S)-4-hydroxy-5-phosphonooxypentane-2,3-dione isomerase